MDQRSEKLSKPHNRGNVDSIMADSRFSPVLENLESENQDEPETRRNRRSSNFEISDEMLEELPWHHIQLYRLYGEQANDFLHPKIDQEIMNQFVKPKRHNNIKLDGMTADELWTKLRKDSTYRLLRRDRAIQQELKAAYSAFIRQCAQQNKTPVKRNFYDKDDVPEIDLLMDQSVSQAVQSYSLKCQLMYRSAVNNENKAEILHHNNPFPNLNDLQGEETIERYLPSWWQTHSDTVSEKSYEKWLREPNSTKTSRTNSLSSENRSECMKKLSAPSSATTKLSAAKILAQKQDEQDWKELVLPRKRANTVVAAPRLRFMTDEAAVVTGDFGKRCKEIEESQTTRNQFVSTANNDNTESLNKVMTARCGDDSNKVSTPNNRCLSEPLLSTEEYNKHFLTTWEPLTEKALIEYKQRIDVMGSGDFNYGRAKMWNLTKT
ncbi:uncharacterized protein LOC141902323 isoform X2 [Tubulanus polymorphus]|uniref:uncharacterized protein LOC141902323 isoform X2 n=1 Tax=Tubulanus polymorphus TaxID=672921 RepID=UPI003DA271C4